MDIDKVKGFVQTDIDKDKGFVQLMGIDKDRGFVQQMGIDKDKIHHSGPTSFGSTKNIVQKLFTREISGDRSWNSYNQGEFNPYDSCDANEIAAQKVHQSPVEEIVAVNAIVFARAKTGVCTAFNRGSRKKLCCLNLTPDQVIRGLFFNRVNESLIIVYQCSFDDFKGLRCRTTPIQYIRMGQPDAGFPLFETESMGAASLVQFDAVNGKALTHSPRNGIYNVYELKNYHFLYSIPENHISHIRISHGIMLLVYERVATGHLPVKILSIDDGMVVQDLEHMLPTQDELDFIEYFNEKILFKQKKQNLHILDLKTSKATEVSRPEFKLNVSIKFLQKHQVVLAAYNSTTVIVSDMFGQRVTSFQLPWRVYGGSNIVISGDQRILITYGECRCADEEKVGSIYITDALTGKCLAKICAYDPNVQVRKEDAQNSAILSSTREALEEITVLFYDEEQQEIFSGNRKGRVHVWSS